MPQGTFVFRRQDNFNVVRLGSLSLVRWVPGCVRGLWLVVICGSPLISGAIVWAEQALQAAPQRLPNFVVVLADDLGYGDLSCYGAEQIRTPNLDELAQRGIRFTSAYAGSPWCSSSRAALLTGCYSTRVNVPGGLWGHIPQGLNPDEITIAELLKTRGYATALFGKWHLGDKRIFLPTRQGFDRFVGIPWSHGGYAPLYDNERIVAPAPNDRTMTRDFNNMAIKFLRDHRDQPVFILLAQPMPHHPLDCSAEFKGHSKAGMYGDVIEELDWSIGELMKEIRELKLEGETLVIFTSDNGPWTDVREGYVGGSAGPLRERKGSVYEGGMRVPFIAYWLDRIPGGRVNDQTICAQDILPTLAALAGAKLPDDRVIDGVDLWPLLSGKDNRMVPHNAFHYFQNIAVRKGPWKLFVGRQELYNLETDIGETRNVAAEHPDVVQELEQLAEKHRQDIAKNGRPLGEFPVP